MTAWKPMSELPKDRPVLIRSENCPMGLRSDGWTVNLAQAGTGRIAGLWVLGMRDFVPEAKKAGSISVEDVATEWADLPK